jgi:hypothetical protein
MRIRHMAMLLGSLMVAGAANAQLYFESERREPGTGKLVARLVDPAGHGLTGSIWLCTPDGCRISQWHSESFRRGRLEIKNLRPGRYQLRVAALGALINDLVPPPPVEFEARAGKTTRVVITAVCP